MPQMIRHTGFRAEQAVAGTWFATGNSVLTVQQVLKEETKMNRFKEYAKIWFLGLALVTFLAGCGSDNSASIVPDSSAKAMTAYSLNGASGIIDESAGTIAVTMPNGTDIKALVATYSTTGASVDVGAAPQTSAVTVNDFTADVDYTVTAADSSAATYAVTVTVALGSAKAITDYSLDGSTGIIDAAAKTISVTVPNGTDVTALVATYTDTGDFVDVGAVPQTTAVTANDFTEPVVYTVTAADDSMATYSVTVDVAPIDARTITSFAINGNAGIIDETGKTIAVTLRSGTVVTALVAEFTATGTSIEVDAVPQTSAITANDFTAPVNYLVTAGDSTAATYTVTVTVSSAQGPAPVNLGTAGNFVILAKTAVSTTGTTAVVGNIGVSPAAASYITGFSLIADATNTFSTSSLVTGSIYAADYAPPTPANMTTATSDMEIAFSDAAGRSNPDYSELHAGDISGQTLVPGLYTWGTGVLITSAGVTLEGGADDVWIFQIAQDLTVGNSAIVTLSGGAQAKNIFWQVSGQATLGTAADFKGILLSKTLTSLNTGAKMTGRALAQTAVTLDATAMTQPAQ